MLNDQIKSLLGEDTISENTAVALVSLIEKAIQNAVAEKETVIAEKETVIAEKVAELERVMQEVCSVKEEKEAIIAKADQAVEKAKEEMNERFEFAVKEATERFLTESRDQFITADRFNRMEKAFNAIRGAFETNGFQLNENVALDEANAKLKEATTKINEANSKIHDLESSLLAAQCSAILSESMNGLAETQKEKVETMLESVEYSTIEEYDEVVKMIVEQVKASELQVAAPVVLKEENKIQNTRINEVLNLLSRK